MEVEYLKDILLLKGFCGEKMDSGYNHTLDKGHIKLICYVEPGIEVEFVSIYRWNDNDVKGTYTISTDHLLRYTGDVASLFWKTKENLPQYIGTTIDTHDELDKVIREVFDVPYFHS